jgi:hypothetical protein
MSSPSCSPKSELTDDRTGAKRIAAHHQGVVVDSRAWSSQAAGLWHVVAIETGPVLIDAGRISHRGTTRRDARYGRCCGMAVAKFGQSLIGVGMVTQ